MEIKEMDNNTLIRHLVLVEREIKTKQSEQKQLKDELNRRFDNQELGE